MKNAKVKDLMVPLSEYATVSQSASLYDAVMALEEAQNKFEKKQYLHRAILVLNEQGHVVGKLSQNDVLMSLEPKYTGIEELGRHRHWELSPELIKTMMRDYGLWEKPMDDLCEKAARMQVKDVMYTPDQGEYVKIDASINEAIHQLVIGRHQSLLVTENEKVVGILRLTDVFREVCSRIKSCPI